LYRPECTGTDTSPHVLWLKVAWETANNYQAKAPDEALLTIPITNKTKISRWKGGLKPLVSMGARAGPNLGETTAPSGASLKQFKPGVTETGEQNNGTPSQLKSRHPGSEPSETQERRKNSAIGTIKKRKIEGKLGIYSGKRCQRNNPSPLQRKRGNTGTSQELFTLIDKAKTKGDPEKGSWSGAPGPGGFSQRK